MRLLSGLALAALAAAPTAQAGWLPFRKPSQKLETPVEVMELLEPMRRIAEAGEVAVSFVEGVEVADSPEWRRLRNELKGKIARKGGQLGAIVWDSISVEDRTTALYGIYYVDDAKATIELIPLIAGEPVYDLRRRHYPRAIEFLNVHWKKGSPHTLNAAPFFGLLRTGDVRDEAQGLWFLTRLLELRPEEAVKFLEESQDVLRKLLTSKNDDVRAHARAFLEMVAPQLPAPRRDEDADRLRWLDAALYQVLPPLRARGTGVLELYPSEDRDKVVAVGREALRGDSIFLKAQGRTRDGAQYRGLRVARLPEPLEKLGIPLDAVLTALNGSPITDGPALLAQVETLVKTQRALLLEYVHEGAQRVMEFRLVQ